MAFPFYRQLNAMDCGPTCLRMIARHYGKHYNADSIRQKAGFNKAGVSMLGISETAEKMGFRTRGVQITYDKLLTVALPAILHWDQHHFVVLTSLTKRAAKVADPASGIHTYHRDEFLYHWISNEKNGNGGVGTVLILEPTPAFFREEGEKEQRLSWLVVSRY